MEKKLEQSHKTRVSLEKRFWKPTNSFDCDETHVETFLERTLQIMDSRKRSQKPWTQSCRWIARLEPVANWQRYMAWQTVYGGNRHEYEIAREKLYFTVFKRFLLNTARLYRTTRILKMYKTLCDRFCIRQVKHETRFSSSA